MQRLPGTGSGVVGDFEPISPRAAQTLELLLDGGSEKQIAAQLGISRHTVHVYVKFLYRHFGVCSRGELMAFVLKAFVKSLTTQSLLDHFASEPGLTGARRHAGLEPRLTASNEVDERQIA
jgi:DNA-binding CsgD family transcriptional regulator